MRSLKEFDEVQRHIAAGLNDCAIARLTGIPRPDGQRLETKSTCSACTSAMDISHAAVECGT